MSDLQNIKKIAAFFIGMQLRYPKLLFGMLCVHPLAVLFLRFIPALIVADILNKLSKQEFTRGDLWGSFGPEIIWAVALEGLGAIVIWRFVIYCNWRLEGYVQRDIERTVFNHLLRLSSSFHANHFGGSLVSQTSKLSGAYVRFTDTTLFQVLGLFWGLLFASVLLVTRVPVFVAILVGFTVLYMVAAIGITRHIRKLNEAEAEASNKQTGYLADAVTNVLAVKSFAAAKAEARQFEAVSENTRHTVVRLMKASLKREAVFSGIGTTISAAALVAATAGVVIFNANIEVTFLVLSYTSDIIQRLWEFSTQALRNYNRAFGDAQSMVEILGKEPDVKDPKKPEKTRISNGAITFHDMSFTHPESRSDDTLFHHLNLEITPSQKLGLVGHSGSGKTTLTKLLLRFNDIDDGQIQIDGQNIAHIAQDDLRAHIAYVPQEPLLFHRSIHDNIAYGKPNASTDDVIMAAKKAFAHDFILSLPDGYNTMVGERGVKLSGGQRQRIAIARAIIKDAPILVLDEATSALDSESEKAIQAALWQLMKGRTAIVIAHRLSTIQKMDRILVLDHGNVIEDGTHQQLLRKKGTYASLWAHQSGGFLEE